MSFFAELKRRNVYRAAVFYAASAWLLVQVATQVFPLFHIAEWVMRWIVVAVVIGFPFALLFSWFYEWTPEGFRRDSEVDPSASIARATGRKLDRWIIAIMAVAIVLLLTNTLVWHTGAGLADKASADAVPDSRLAAAHSIAVLPFQNMSDDRNNEYFADGIAEELLNRLAHVPALQVAGRTSSFAFRDRGQDLREIAAKLGVANILEGSVRRAGSRVRITAQLIKAQDGFHAWSQTYDRDLTDIFAVQDEIAGAIADALKLNLIGHQTATPVPVDAYDAYLKAQSLVATRDVGNMEAARKQFRTALDLAPDYVPAMVALARANLLIPMWTQETGARIGDLLQEAEQLTLHALAIEPDNAAAHAALGTLYANFRWRWQDAGREFTRALELAPGSAEITNFAGDFYRMLLDPERALATEQRALALDPLAPYNHDDLGWVGVAFGDYPKAIEHANATRAMAPDLFDPYFILVWSYGRLQRFSEMHKTIAEAHERAHGAEPQFLTLDAWAAIAEGRRDDGLSIQSKLDAFVERGEFSSALHGFNYLLLGDSLRARRWLERAYEQHDYSLVFQEPVELARIAADPVTRDLLERPGLKELVEIRKRNGAFKLP